MRHSVICTLLAVLLLAVVSAQCHGHSHDDHDDHGHAHDHHGHSHGGNEEPASFKYSRQANIVEDEILEEDIVDVPPGFSSEKPKSGGGGAKQHGHSHDDGHGHGGGGGHHGHSHGGGGGGHHGHSHGPPQREPTAEEREKHRQRLHKIWDDEEDEEGAPAGGKKYQIWLYALSSTLAISLAPFAILFFFTLDNSEAQQGKLKVLLSFASGGLLGDAFLHLIPHAIMAQEGQQSQEGGGSHGHSHGGGHGHSHGEEGGHAHDMTVGLGVLGGILAFLVVEKVVRIYSDSGHGHSHGGGGEAKTAGDSKKGDAKKEGDKVGAKAEETKKRKAKLSDREESEEEEEGEKDGKGEKTKKKEDKDEKKPAKAAPEAAAAVHEEVRVAGYLNLFADFFHNFTDGLAIGASFLAGHSVGLVTTFTILFHEIPHEIGDYAILIQSGVKPFRAKCLQLLTALGAFAGCVVSLMAGGIGDAVTAYILPFTAGGFIYIATVSVIPELLEGSTLRQSLSEIAALLAGVAMMVVIAQYE